MDTNGFQLRKLQITGIDVRPAEIQFAPGLNVISGPSDTGKSYLFQCIDYMLGGTEPPKPIPESRGYTTIELSIVSNTNEEYILERNISEGAYLLHTSGSKNSPKTLEERHNSDNPDNISTFLLSLSGINKNIKIRKNNNLQTENLTFRSINHLFLVNETEIIRETSPVHNQIVVANTPSKWSFHFLLTGEEDSSLVSIPDPKIIKAQDLAKREVYDVLISNLERRIGELEEREKNSVLKGSELENEISKLTESLSISNIEISNLYQSRKQAWEKNQETASRIIVINELLIRFDLLKQHYESDLHRLNFMSEGDYYFEQLETVYCPLCGTALVDHDAKARCIEKNGELINLQTACKQEAEKTRNHLNDLQETFITLENERSELQKRALIEKETITNLDHELTEILRPRYLAQKKELDQLIEFRRLLDELEINRDRVKELWVARANIEVERKSTNPTIPKKSKSTLNEAVLQELSSEIEQILLNWKYISSRNLVYFNEKNMDVVIDGKARKSHGKGVRALILSSFCIGLMHHCQSKNKPHPRLVVLDSPLLNYKEKIKISEKEEISEDVKKAFFNDLARISKTEQIIIFENETPPADVKESMNYIEFVGISGHGRKGFFPEYTLD